MVVLGAGGAQSEDDISGFNNPLPGRYHVVVNSVDESFNEVDKIVMEFAVLKGTVPGQETKTIREYFSVQGANDKKTAGCLIRLQRLALVLGLLLPKEKEKEISFEDGLGRQLVVDVVENRYTDRSGNEKVGVRVDYLGFWSVWNPTVQDVPFDEAARASVPRPAQWGGSGGNDGTTPPAGSGASKPPQSGPAAPSRQRPATTTATPAANQSQQAPPQGGGGDVTWKDV